MSRVVAVQLVVGSDKECWIVWNRGPAVWHQVVWMLRMMAWVGAHLPQVSVRWVIQLVHSKRHLGMSVWVDLAAKGRRGVGVSSRSG